MISSNGIEWLCKNVFNQKYLELLEKYKMELTELYIEKGYIYDEFFGKKLKFVYIKIKNTCKLRIFKKTTKKFADFTQNFLFNISKNIIMCYNTTKLLFFKKGGNDGRL